MAILKPSDKDIGKTIKKENGKEFGNGKKKVKVKGLLFNISTGKTSYKIEDARAGYMVSCDECEFV